LRESKTRGDRRAFCHLHRRDRASARSFSRKRSHRWRDRSRTNLRARWCSLLNRRFLAGVRNDVQAGQPKTVRPTLALADLGSKPGPVVINACLRTEALERAAIPHQTELAMAVSAVVLHSYPHMASVEPNRLRIITPHVASQHQWQCTISITALNREFVCALSIGRKSVHVGGCAASPRPVPERRYLGFAPRQAPGMPIEVGTWPAQRPHIGPALTAP